MTNAPPSASASVESPEFRLRTLGATLLEQRLGDGGFERAAVGGKSLGVLIYLSAQEGRAVSREHLADLFWGDETPENARGSLRQAVFVLRRALGKEAIPGEGDAISLDGARLAVDRDAFLAAARAGDIATALAEYQGDFCDRLEVGRAREIEQWIVQERARLRRLVVEMAVSHVSHLMGMGEPASALEIARRVCELTPDDPDAAALLFDALVATGAIREARERLERFTSGIDHIPRVIADRQARLTRVGPTIAIPAQDGIGMLGQTLVGRDEILASLLREVEQARMGGPRRCIVLGPAGAGKTRILEEFRARMQLRGARMVHVRCMPAVRDVPYAVLADLVRALCDLPGSAGVSEVTASQLVALLPELSARYRAARAAEPADAHQPRLLRHALSDLLDSVASERLVIVLVDDFHNADETSRQLIAAAMRSPSLRLLDVWGMRPAMSTVPLAADVELTLSALSLDDMRALMSEVALLPAEPWMDNAINRIHAQCQGMPNQAMQLIRSLVAKDLLHPVNGEWRTTDATRLSEGIAASLGIAETIANLSPNDRLVLQFLCSWGRPIDERDLEGVIRAAGILGQRSDVRPILTRLEVLGLARPLDTHWSVGHDTVADALVRIDGKDALDACLSVHLDFWCADHRLAPAVVDHLALLCGNADSLAGARRLAHAAGHSGSVRRTGLRGHQLARSIANSAGRPEWESELYRALGFIARQSRSGLVGLGAFVVAIVTLLLWAVSVFQPRLVVEAVPVSIPTDGEGGRLGVGFVVQPRVGVYDGRGRRLVQFEGQVRARGSGGRLVGDTVQPFSEGRVQFLELGFQEEPAKGEAVYLEFSSSWWVRSAQVRASGFYGMGVDGLRLQRTYLDGELLDDPTVARIAPGSDSIPVVITFEFTASNPVSNYVVGVAPTWVPRERATIRLAGLPRPVANAWQTVGFKVAPPPTVGVHYLIIAMDQEGSVEHLFSQTNWSAGSPVWNDGNDITDLPTSAIEALRKYGSIDGPGSLVGSYTTPQGMPALARRAAIARIPFSQRTRTPRKIMGAVIKLEVVAAP